MKNIIIEKFSAKNFGNFTYLIEKLAEYEKLAPPNEKAKKRLRKDGLSKNPKFEAFLAKLNNEYVGCGRIDLCILDWNKPSINFFEKNNAKHLNWLFYRIDVGSG